MKQKVQSLELVIGLGANCGDRRSGVAEAIEWLRKRLSAVRASRIYETPPYGHAGTPYMNAVVIGIYTKIDSLDDFERECKRYEIECGRDEFARSQNLVPIDIDIVMVGKEILRPADFNRSFFQIGYKQLRGE